MSALRISVPPRYRAGSFEDAADSVIIGMSRIMWVFRRDPGVKQGDPIVFVMDRKIVAEATIAHVLRPGGGRKWFVRWRDFQDVREDDEIGFEPRLYGDYPWRTMRPASTGSANDGGDQSQAQEGRGPADDPGCGRAPR